MNTKEVKLSSPLMVNGNALETLQMKEPNMGLEEDAYSTAVQLKKELNPISVEMCLFAMLCSLSYDHMRSLSRKDYDTMRGVYQSFFIVAPTMEEQEISTQKTTLEASETQ